MLDVVSSSYRRVKSPAGILSLLTAIRAPNGALVQFMDKFCAPNLVVLSTSSYVLWTGSHELGHKHLLHDNFERYIELCGDDASSVAHFWPRCWQLSCQPQREAAMAALTQAYAEWSQKPCDVSGAAAGAREEGLRQSEEPLWILKPINQSRGLGIRLISQWKEISPDEVSGCLVQR